MNNVYENYYNHPVNKRDQSFLDDLQAVLRKHNVDCLFSPVDESDIYVTFENNYCSLTFKVYDNNEMFTDVTSVSDDTVAISYYDEKE